MVSDRCQWLTNSGPVPHEALVSSTHVEIFAAAASLERILLRDSLRCGCPLIPVRRSSLAWAKIYYKPILDRIQSC